MKLGPTWHPASMKVSHIALSATALLLLACPKAETAPGGSGEAAKASPGSATSGGEAKAQASSGARISEDEVVATWDGGKMTYGELLEAQKAAFEKLERKQAKERYQLEQRQLEGHIVKMLVEKAAKKKGQTEEEYFKALGANQNPTEGEMKAFYEENVKSSGQPYEAVKGRIQQYLMQNKARETFQAEIERLKKQANVQIDLPAPEVPKVSFDLEGEPFMGKPGAPVEVVAFSDFECPYCARATSGVEKLLEAYPGKVKVYFMHFPLSFHKKAMPAAIASECAHAQDEFWAFHDKVFENQKALSEDKLTAWAKDIGLDMEKFQACMDDPSTKKEVMADMEQGKSAGVQGTPSFFINGEQYDKGVPSVEALQKYVKGT